MKTAYPLNFGAIVAQQAKEAPFDFTLRTQHLPKAQRKDDANPDAFREVILRNKTGSERRALVSGPHWDLYQHYQGAIMALHKVLVLTAMALNETLSTTKNPLMAQGVFDREADNLRKQIDRLQWQLGNHLLALDASATSAS